MRNKIQAKFVLVCILWLSLLFGCEHEQSTAPVIVKATFSGIQSTILTPKCVNAGCHPGGGAPMSLRSDVAYGNLVNAVSSGYAPRLRVKPDDPDNSILYLKVIGDPQTGFQMPFGAAPLSSAEVDSIRTWIEQGAQNN